MTYSREYLEEWQGSPLTEAQIRWEKCLIPIMANVPGMSKPKQVLKCAAYLVAENDMKLYPIPPEWQEIVYGQPVPGLELQQFSTFVRDIPDTDTFIFGLSANYILDPPPKGRALWTTAEDCDDWWPYPVALGYTMADVMNWEEAKAMLPDWGEL